MKTLIFCLFLSVYVSCGAFSQNFTVGNPLDITPAFSGNFGELRPNHFHAGIDLKTAGREGLEVMAVADGHVSRIRISPYGYGKVLYIDHPEGYTTVYAHLQRLSGTIAKYAREQQYLQQSFEIDIYPGKDDLPVRSGQLIAISGNTGGSGGPHLHFEVRETSTEVPRNPLVFGFPISDSKSPVIDAIGIAPITPQSKINGSKKTVRFRTAGGTIATNSTVQIEGGFGIEVSGYDSQDGSANRNGIYTLDLFLDDAHVSRFKADSIPFHQSRHLNALIDYEHYYKTGIRYTRLYRLPGNALENLFYKNDGMLHPAAGKHHIKVVASDYSGNAQTITFEVTVNPPTESEVSTTDMLYWDLPYAYDSEHFRLYFPKNTVYENTPLIVNEFLDESPARIEILRPELPVQEPFQIAIKLQNNTNAEHAMVMRTHKDGKPAAALNTKNDGDWLIAESKSFGSFAIHHDENPPEIRNINISNGLRWSSGQMKLVVKDNLSGVHTYTALANDQWVLMEYEPKQDLLTIDVNELPSSTELQQLTIKISDLAGNVATFEGTFYHE